MSAAAALVVSAALTGCGSTTYFAGRTLPPSGLTHRVLIAIQNPSSATSGSLQFVDANYDIRYKYNSTSTGAQFFISSYSGKLPSSIQNMPDEQVGAVYNSSGGTLSLINYAKETASGSVTFSGTSSSSAFVTRSEGFAFAAQTGVLTVVNRTAGTSYALSAPDPLYRVSVNSGGSVALVFARNSNHVYYPRQLTAAETTNYSGGSSTWPMGAVDCEPQSAPGWCLFQALDPSKSTKANPVPLTFDQPVKAVFSADGGTAYVLNCGPECGGTKASITSLPVAPLIFTLGQQSGTLPTQATLDTNTLAIPGGASNALVDSSTLYVVGQQLMPDKLWGGYLTVVDLATPMTASSPVSISDGAPGAVSRMILADDDTLWIGMTDCINGERASTSQADGCLTMVNTSTSAATLMPYNGDATGIAAVTGLHKIYTAEGGQVYIYATGGGSLAAGTAIDNEYVTVTGTAYDVAYMDGVSDSNNTVY